MSDNPLLLKGENNLSGCTRHVVACMDGHIGFWYRSYDKRDVADHMASRIREGDVVVPDESGQAVTPERVLVYECELTPNEAVDGGGGA